MNARLELAREIFAFAVRAYQSFSAELLGAHDFALGDMLAGHIVGVVRVSAVMTKLTIVADAGINIDVTGLWIENVLTCHEAYKNRSTYRDASNQ